MEFTLVDGGVAFIVVVSAIMAYSRGLTREVLAIAGWAVAGIAAMVLTPMVEPLVREIPVVGPFLGSSCVLSVVAAFTLIMALGLLIMAVFTPVFSSMVRDSALGMLDRVLGFVFGVARGALLVAVAFMLYQAMAGDANTWPALASAGSYPYLVEASVAIQDAMPGQLPPWLSERIDAMMAPCSASGEVIDPATLPEGQSSGNDA